MRGVRHHGSEGPVHGLPRGARRQGVLRPASAQGDARDRLKFIPVQIPLSKEATQAGPWYLKSLPRPSTLLGDALYRANAPPVFEWIDRDDAFLATVLDREGEHEVDMHFDGKKWHGECTCRKASDCEHCYAALASLLAANRRVLL